MPRNRKFGKTCKYCGEELTTLNTSINNINDKNYICFGCLDNGRTRQGGSRIERLQRDYDPNAFKLHEKIDRKSNKHFDRMELLEEAVLKPVIPREKLYPTPKGRSIIIRHMEVECSQCHYILTTTNAYPERVRFGGYICKRCMGEQREELNTDPLYQEKKELKSILLKIYNRRRLKQFTWEYIETRFAKVQERTVSQVDKEEYDKTVKLFGEEYAAKRFRPKTTNALQESLGDLSSREGCRKLLTLFEYELYKSRHSGKRKKEKWEASQMLEKFDAPFRNKTDINKGITSADSMEVFDAGYQSAYYATSTKLLRQENKYK